MLRGMSLPVIHSVLAVLLTRKQAGFLPLALRPDDLGTFRTRASVTDYELETSFQEPHLNSKEC